MGSTPSALDDPAVGADADPPIGDPESPPEPKAPDLEYLDSNIDRPFFIDGKPAEEESLLGENWLFRGGWSALIAPTGQGKSSLSFQMAACWSLAKPCFGIVPIRELKVLIVQTENGEGDLYEFTEGIANTLGLSDEERATVKRNVTIITPPSPGPDVFKDEGIVKNWILKNKPDLVILDSLYKWTESGEAITGKDIVGLMDRIVMLLCKQVGAGCIANHHMGRSEVERIGSGKGTQLTDLYAGAGGMFVADNARATLLLVPSGERGEYTLKAAKRGSRIGWRDDEGNKVYEQYIKWASGHIGWEKQSGEERFLRERERQREKAQQVNDRFARQILWAIEQVTDFADEDGWIPRKKIAAIAATTKGPIPQGIQDRKFRDMVDVMVGMKLIEQKGKDRRPKFIRKA